MPTTLPGTYLDRPLPRFEQQWEKPDLIILDEFGIVPAGKSNAEPFFDVIATANKRNSTVLTSALKMDRNPWERTTYRPPRIVLPMGITSLRHPVQDTGYPKRNGDRKPISIPNPNLWVHGEFHRRRLISVTRCNTFTPPSALRFSQPSAETRHLVSKRIWFQPEDKPWEHFESAREPLVGPKHEKPFSL